MRRLSLAALLSSLVVVNVAAQASAPQSLIPRFEAAPCPFEPNARVSGQVRCGYVTVLENRSKPDGRRLRLAVAILKSFSGTPRPDPLVPLAGGPGERLVARHLLVDVPSAGHIGMFAHRCTQGLTQDFLGAPLQRRDTSCLQAIPPIEFVTEVKGLAW